MVLEVNSAPRVGLHLAFDIFLSLVSGHKIIRSCTVIKKGAVTDRKSSAAVLLWIRLDGAVT